MARTEPLHICQANINLNVMTNSPKYVENFLGNI